MGSAIERFASIPGAQRRVGFLFAPVAAVAWVLIALLALAVRVALFRQHLTQGAASVLWGLGFALFLWAGLLSLGIHNARAVPFGLVAGAAIALFVYLRGAALESPPVEQPGVFHRRLLARRRANRTSGAVSRPDAPRTRELSRARIALDRGELEPALFWLQEAERVAVAQRKLGELLEVRELLSEIAARSRGRAGEASGRLARRLAEHLDAFPSDALASAGIHKEPERDLSAVMGELRARAGSHGDATTRELTRARAALGDGDFSAALQLLQEARRVAVAQHRLGELLEVHELVQALSDRSAGRTRAASERLARTVEAGLRSFARAASV